MPDQQEAKNGLVFSIENETIAWPGHKVFDELSLTIKQGEKVALIGKSGSGKSTLLRHLYRQNARMIAFCEQRPGLVPGLSCFHNIYMGQLDRHHFLYNLVNLFFPLNTQKVKVAELAKNVGLLEKLQSKAELLSGGQQQRVALARSLFQEKTIFLGDEPVSALDETQADVLLSLIMARHESVVVALHNTLQALKYCDRVIGLQNGRIVIDQPSSQLVPSDLSQFYTDNAPSNSELTPINTSHSVVG